jgi:hypothetical protein
LTGSDAQAFTPANAALVNGIGTFAVTFKTAGNQTVSAVDSVTSSIKGTSATIFVTAAPAARFVLGGTPAAAFAGDALLLTIVAQDSFGNVATGYSGPVNLSSTDGQAVLQAGKTLAAGAGVFSVSLRTVGNQTVTATDTVLAAIRGTSSAIVVNAGNTARLAVSLPPTTIVAGTAFSFTVTAQDSFGNNATGYAGTVAFASSDNQALLPANATLANGMGIFSATLKKAGAQTVTATDTVNSSIMVVSPSITVNAAAATHISVITPTSAAAGTPFNFTIAAFDQFNNPATGYTGTIHFSSTDPQAILPPDTTLAGSTSTFSATLKKAGYQTLTAADTVIGGASATSNGITCNAGALAHFAILGPVTSVAGAVFGITVTAQDVFNNIAANYNGTVHLTSSDSQALLQIDGTLQGGVGFFAVGLRTAGVDTLSATDAMGSAATGGCAVTVTAAAPNHFVVTGQSSVTAGSPVAFTVTPQDPYGNGVTNYAGTIHFSSSDAQAALPSDTSLLSGSLAATLKTAGLQTITVTDVAAGISGSTAISVHSAAAVRLSLVAPLATGAGTPIVFVVMALDSFNNTAKSYSGTLHFTSSDGQAGLPLNATLTAGVGYFAAALKTAGNQTLDAADVVTGSIAGTSAAMNVSAAAASRFKVTVPASAITGSAFAITVTAQDQFANTASTYHGTIHFSSSDINAALPADGTLTAGVGTFTARLFSPGDEVITATDVVTGTFTGTSSAISTRGLTVTNVTATPSGFVATFNKPFDPNQINLYDQAGSWGADDVLLTGPGAPQVSIRGSLVIDTSHQTVTFIKSSTFNGPGFNPASGALAAGTYTVTFRSAANGFRDSLGGPLDGANSGNTAGSNYIATFVVGAAPVVVGVPSFARGPDSTQVINLPNSQSVGIPLNVSAGSGVTSGTFTLQYNPALLNITGATVNTALVGAVMALDTASTPGNAIIRFSSASALTAAGVVRLGGLAATVPNSAAALYKSKALLHWSGVQLNGGAMPAVGDDSVEVVAYFGDATGDGTLSGGDASAIGRVSTATDTNSSAGTLAGFSAFPLADPSIVGDLNTNGNADAPDITLLNSLLAGTAHTQIPSIPVGLTIVPTGPDPELSLPSTLQVMPGGTVSVPVNIDTAHPDGSTGATEVILALRYDPRVFEVSAADIALGSLTSGSHTEWEVRDGWQLTAFVNDQTGEIGIDLVGNEPIETAAGGSLVTIALHASSSVPPGASALTLVSSVNPTGQRVFQTEVADAQGALVLHQTMTANGFLPAAPAQVIVGNETFDIGPGMLIDGPSGANSADVGSTLPIPVTSISAASSAARDLAFSEFWQASQMMADTDVRQTFFQLNAGAGDHEGEQASGVNWPSQPALHGAMDWITDDDLADHRQSAHASLSSLDSVLIDNLQMNDLDQAGVL